jgi:hypothetical protein
MNSYSGRYFTSEEITQIRRLIEEDPSRSRAQLSRLVCKMFAWYKPDGGLKEMSCRVAMLRMQRDGLIQLPPPRCKKPVCKIIPGHRTNPQFSISAPVHKLPCIRLKSVRSMDESRLWNEYIERYHYLGFTLVPGAQRRYFVLSGDQTVALLSFSASAWQVAPRDSFIGWSNEQRKRNLHLIVNNARFLILPWVKSKGLASKTLAMAAKQVPDDWESAFGYRPILMESFVEKQRFKGTCYKAANWINVGQTKGRGKLGPAGKLSVPIKDIWLLPLKKQFRTSLTV